MSQPVVFSLVALSLVLCLLPLTLAKPGLPATLKSDEPAYYMMAQSLAHDLDLRVEEHDVERVFREFPFRPVSNLIVMSDDGWRSVFYGKPYVYSLLAAPFVGLLGANGMLTLNMLLVVGMIWLGALYLRRFNPDWIAALFAVGFFLLSAAFAYVFWLHPEIFTMFGVALSLWLGFRPPAESRRRRWIVMASSGAALTIVSYNKPMLLALALPILGRALLDRRWKEAALWCAGALVAGMAVLGGSMVLTGQPTPYLGAVRQGVTVCEEGVVPIAPGPEGGAAPLEDRPTGGAWSWVFRIPDVDWWMLLENSLYFVGGRHTGLFLYFPFAVLAVVLFLLHATDDRPSRQRWLLLAALAGIALFFLVFIPRNWQGGGGFVGNRYYVNAYPAFLFLVTAIRPPWTVPVTYGWAALFLAPLVFTPLGAAEPHPTLQSHVRNAPFTHFPLELTLREIPGYEEVDVGDQRLIGRKDQIQRRGESLWIRGGGAAEILLVGGEPRPERIWWQIRSLAPANRVRLEMGEAEKDLRFQSLGEGWETQNVALEPGRAERFTRVWGESVPVHTLTVEPESGRNVLWTKRFPPPRCPGSNFAFWESVQDNFYVGAEITFLGTGEALASDVFSVIWRQARAPREVGAGEPFEVQVTLENTSDNPWEASGSARVKLAYHWRHDDGEMVVFDGLRTELPLPVAPGKSASLTMEVEAPSAPGDYTLLLDPVFEHVGWFSQRGAEPLPLPVRVTS